MQQSLYKIRKCVTVWSRIAVVTDDIEHVALGMERGDASNIDGQPRGRMGGGHESKRGAANEFQLTTGR